MRFTSRAKRQWGGEGLDATNRPSVLPRVAKKKSAMRTDIEDGVGWLVTHLLQVSLGHVEI